MLLYFLKIDFFFLSFIYSPDKKREEQKAISDKSNDDVPSLRSKHLRLAKRAHCAHC
jgi:hypothetical protein